MQLTTLIVLGSLLLSLLALSLALWAVTTARSSSLALHRKLDSSSTRSLVQLDAEMSELTTAFQSMSTTMRRLSSKLGMQEVRERRKGEQLPANFNELSPAQRKAILRKGLATGSLTAISDNGTKVQE